MRIISFHLFIIIKYTAARIKAVNFSKYCTYEFLIWDYADSYFFINKKYNCVFEKALVNKLSTKQGWSGGE